MKKAIFIFLLYIFIAGPAYAAGTITQSLDGTSD